VSRGAAIIPPEVLLSAYCEGIFPMARSKDGPVEWFTADPRGIIEIEAFRIPKRLRSVLRAQKFEIRINTAFEDVLRACADRTDTWVSETIVQSYLNLHRLGFAHSVEAWQEMKLVGGLYGVAIGGAFFGESMFHQVSDSSKVALVHLVERLRSRGYCLLDTQTVTPLMQRFGARTISLDQYLERLKMALKVKCRFD